MTKRTFKDLTPAGQRIAIAKDVIQHVEAMELRSAYCDANIEDLVGLPTPSWAQQNCQLCGIGSAAISALKLSGEKTLPDTWNDDGYLEAGQDDILEVLEPYFSEQQALDIEAVFEHGGSNNVSGNLSHEWYRTYSNPEDPEDRKDLLKAIMANIVRNGGTFKPDEVTA